MVLSSTQRAKILLDIADIAEDLEITVLDERQRIENIDDFPLIQTTFLSEGRRQSLWAFPLHEFQYETSHEWDTYFGHFAQATVSVSIRSLDIEELQLLAGQFSAALWQQAINWRFENTSKMEWRGAEAPKFLPAYIDAVEHRHDIYSCVIDFFVDYEFSWVVENDPIRSIWLNPLEVGLVDTEDYSDEIVLVTTAPGVYLAATTIHGPPIAYRADVIILEASE